MRDGVTAFALLGFIWLIAAKLNDRVETTHSGQFHAVDGDSLTIGGERMRLLNIDAPELNQTCERAGKSWSCGREAKAMLQNLAASVDMQCSGDDRDRYQRLLVVCRSGGLDINGAMVGSGMAVSYGGYRDEEEQAKAERAGLWAGAFEMPRNVRDHEPHRSTLEGIAGFFGWQ
jgi:endonuclease YncB( thermonuclease family)